MPVCIYITHTHIYDICNLFSVFYLTRYPSFLSLFQKSSFWLSWFSQNCTFFSILSIPDHILIISFFPFLCCTFFKKCFHRYLIYCCWVAKSYLTLCNPMGCSTPGFSVLHCLWKVKSESESLSVMASSLWPRRLYVHVILQARLLEWVPLCLLPGIFPTQGWNPGLPHSMWILYKLSHRGSPHLWEFAQIHCPLNQWYYLAISSSAATLLHLPSIFPSIKVSPNVTDSTH